jgi:hypothetical protein
LASFRVAGVSPARAEGIPSGKLGTGFALDHQLIPQLASFGFVFRPRNPTPLIVST